MHEVSQKLPSVPQSYMHDFAPFRKESPSLVVQVIAVMSSVQCDPVETKVDCVKIPVLCPKLRAKSMFVGGSTPNATDELGIRRSKSQYCEASGESSIEAVIRHSRLHSRQQSPTSWGCGGCLRSWRRIACSRGGFQPSASPCGPARDPVRRWHRQTRSHCFCPW